MGHSLRVGSLFSGIGGMDLGLERAGFEVSWFVESNPYARAVLSRHWPDVPQWHDVRTFPPGGIAASWGVDLIAGGFPCQPISRIGRQKIKKEGSDDRWLWWDMARICSLLRPRYVLAENVATLLSATDSMGRRGSLMGVVLRDLAQIGYCVEWHSVPASSVGAPHRRDRCFLVGTLADPDDARLERHTGDGSRVRERGRHDERPHRLVTASHLREYGGGRGTAYWSPKCRMDRGAHGLPGGLDECRGWECGLPRMTTGEKNRVPRLTALGNAVVPAVAEMLGRAIMKRESRR